MKKITLYTMAAAVLPLFLACSAEEQVTETKANRFSSEDIGKGLAEGMGNIEIDFTRLFEYATIEEVQKETHKAIEGITRDALNELAERPDSNRAFIGFYVFNGTAGLTTVCFVDTNENVIRENFVYFDKGIRDYTHIFNDPLAQQLFIDSFFTNAEQLFRVNKDKDALNNFLRLKLQDPKTKGIAQFIVVVDTSDTVVLGMP
jgi:hypothetical protein